jgi:hypothetical protein
MLNLVNISSKKMCTGHFVIRRDRHFIYPLFLFNSFVINLFFDFIDRNLRESIVIITLCLIDFFGNAAFLFRGGSIYNKRTCLCF